MKNTKTDKTENKLNQIEIIKKTVKNDKITKS